MLYGLDYATQRVCMLARQMLKNCRIQDRKLFERLGVTDTDEMCVLIAALCHELGN